MSVVLDRLFQVIPNASVEELNPDVKEYLQGLLESCMTDGSGEDVVDSLIPFLEDAGVEVDENVKMEMQRILSEWIPSVSNDDDEPTVLPIQPLDQHMERMNLVSDEPSLDSVSPKNDRKHRKSDKKLAKRKPSSESTPANDAWMDPIQAPTRRFHVDTITTLSNDIDLPGVHIVVSDTDLLEDTRLKLMSGVHYGLVGENGVGKTALMKCIGYGLIPGLPKNVRILYVEQIELLDTGLPLVQSVLLADRLGIVHRKEKMILEKALDSGDSLEIAQCIRQIEYERAVLELEEAKLIALKRSGARGAAARRVLNDAEAEMELKKSRLETECTAQELHDASETAQQLLRDIYERRILMSEEDALSKAKKILRGLGFSIEQLERPLSELSSGWQGRVALARALFIQPDILLLDEPQNLISLGCYAMVAKLFK